MGDRDTVLLLLWLSQCRPHPWAPRGGWPIWEKGLSRGAGIQRTNQQDGIWIAK